MSDQLRRQSASDRVLGGSLLGVVVRLVVLSFVVGLVLTALDIDPTDIVTWVEARVRSLTSLSFDAVGEFVNIMLLGAVIVVPIWLLMRVLKLIGR